MKTKTIWIVAGILAVLLIIVIANSGEPQTNTAQRDFNSPESISMAKVMSEKLISQRLKAPSTAEFTNDPKISYVGDSTYEVIGYVDSQNSFGAKLRMNYTAQIKFINVIGTQEEWDLVAFSKK